MNSFNNKRRTFTCYEPSTAKCYGRYIGRSPKQAASKCATKIFRNMQHSGENTNQPLHFVIRETTMDSKKKYSHYKANRITLQVPRQRTLGSGVTIINHYCINITRLPPSPIDTSIVVIPSPSLPTDDFYIGIDSIPKCDAVIEI